MPWNELFWGWRKSYHNAIQFYNKTCITIYTNHGFSIFQLSFDRKHMVELLLEQWEGPVSLALYVTDAEAAHFEDFALNSQILRKRTNVGCHVVYKEGVSRI